MGVRLQGPCIRCDGEPWCDRTLVNRCQKEGCVTAKTNQERRNASFDTDSPTFDRFRHWLAPVPPLIKTCQRAPIDPQTRDVFNAVRAQGSAGSEFNRWADPLRRRQSIHSPQNHGIEIFDVQPISRSDGIRIRFVFTDFVAGDLLKLLLGWLKHEQLPVRRQS